MVIHAGTNNAEFDTPEVIIDKLLKLRDFIRATCPSCKIIFSSLVNRFDDEVARKIVEKTNALLAQLDVPCIDNANIKRNHLGIKGLHLSENGSSILACIIIRKIKSL